MKSCEKCHVKTKLAYYHNNKLTDKKWNPMLYFCPKCSTIYSYGTNRKNISSHKKVEKDNRYSGPIHGGIIGKINYFDQISDDMKKTLIQKLNRQELRQLKKTETNKYCGQKTVKLYSIFRIEGKQKWVPVFLYCIACKKVVSKF